MENSSFDEEGFWSWTGIGIVVGGIAGAVWAGEEMRKSGDAMFPTLGFAIGIGTGGIVGGVVGALLYTVSHPPNHT